MLSDVVVSRYVSTKESKVLIKDTAPLFLADPTKASWVFSYVQSSLKLIALNYVEYAQEIPVTVHIPHMYGISIMGEIVTPFVRNIILEDGLRGGISLRWWSLANTTFLEYEDIVLICLGPADLNSLVVGF